MMKQSERNEAYERIRRELGVDRMGTAADAPPLPPRSTSTTTGRGASLDIEAEMYGAQMYEYGEIWARPGLDLRTRCFVTLAVLTALRLGDQLYRHINSALNVGITPDEIHETLLHAGVYSGLPAWENGIEVANEVFVNRGILPPGPGDVPVEPKPPMDHEERQNACLRVVQELGLGRVGLGPDAATLKALPGGPDLSGSVENTLLNDPLLNDLSMIYAYYGFGEVWGRDGLDMRTRSFITISVLQAMRENHELHIHINNACNLGIAVEEIHEALAQAGIYGGISGWHNATIVAQHVFEQRG